MIGTTRIPNTPHSEIRVIEPEDEVGTWSTKTKNKKKLYFTSSSQPGYVVSGRIVHFRALYIIRIVILTVVVMVFVAIMLVVVIVMFVDESLRGALADVKVVVWVVRLLSNSNSCQANNTAERTELHPF